jgi:rubrerythrin
MQAEALLKIVKKKLKKVHVRIDRQEGDHRNLFVAYFEQKARLSKEAD